MASGPWRFPSLPLTHAPVRRARRMLGCWVGATALVSLIASPATANVITMTVAAPMIPAGKTATATVNYLLFAVGAGNKFMFSNIISGTAIAEVAGMTATAKRDALLAQMKMDVMGLTPAPTLAAMGNNQITITGLNKVTKNGGMNTTLNAISFTATNGAESPDILSSKDDPTAAFIEFKGTFDSTDDTGALSLFTAGIHSDLGPKNVVVSADSSQVSSLTGAGIADTLFADLDPFASSLGVIFNDDTISPTDGRLGIIFPPGSAPTNGGITFGTTSFDGTVIGAINTNIPEPTSLALLGSALLGFGAIRRRRNRV
jgi:PEP-CTERM motif